MRASILISVLFLAACSGSPSFLSGPAPEVGEIAPDFTLEDLNGDEVSLSDFRGQVLLVNFWATWCAPCREEMPAIQSHYDQGGFAVLAVDFGESAKEVRGYFAELGVDLPVVLDQDGQVQDLYRIRGYPTSFFIDRDGIVRFLHIGQMNETDIQNYLTQLEVKP